MLDIIPCTTCEANEVWADIEAILNDGTALCEPCEQGHLPVPLNLATMNERIESMNTCQHQHYSTSAVDCGYHNDGECYLATCDNCNAVVAHHTD